MVFLWTTFISCSAHPVILPAEFLPKFKEIHSRVYKVYSMGIDRDAIHDLLSESFTGEALTQEYIEHFTTLKNMETEETSIDVLNVEYNKVDALENSLNGVRLDVDWSVGGIVTHQNHKHTRVNRYRAVYTLNGGDIAALRITDTKMRNLERVQRASVSDDDFFDGKEGGGGFLDPLDLIDGGLMDK